jgi:undecaprenyl-diphosphatase
MLSFLDSWDVGLFVLINQKGENHFFDWFMPFMTDLKNFIYVFPLLAIWILWKEKQRGIITLVFLGLTITITDQLSSHFLKEWVGRVRPCHVLEQVRLVLTDCNTSYSFPSSHAVNIFAAAYFLSQPLKRFAWPFYFIASLVAYSRVYIGIHYPLDNILGAGIGILVAWPLWRLGDLTWKKIIARPRGVVPKNRSCQK